jgi:hypothetical protein
VGLSDLRALSRRDWLITAAGGVVLVLLTMAAVWTVRHGWAVYRLNRGVGDTVFYDAGGRPWFRLDEHRRDVPLGRISPYFKDAVVAVEDHRFYLHPGIDPIALTRAAVNNLRSGTGTQGGSTITQQLARTLYLSNTRTYARKLQEAALAVMLELFLSKNDILELYFNRIYLGRVRSARAHSRRRVGRERRDARLGRLHAPGRARPARRARRAPRRPARRGALPDVVPSAPRWLSDLRRVLQDGRRSPTASLSDPCRQLRAADAAGGPGAVDRARRETEIHFPVVKPAAGVARIR